MKSVQVLLDMDGVIANFVKGCMDAHLNGMCSNEFYKDHLGVWDLVPIIAKTIPGFSNRDFWHPMEYDFWATLDPMHDAFDLILMLEARYGQENITVCTSPSWNHGCVPGKQAWLRKHLPEHYWKISNQMFCSKKWLAAHPRTILIDDHDKNCRDFFDRGGHSVLVPRLWNCHHHTRDKALQHVKVQLDRIDGTISDTTRGFYREGSR